MSNNADRWFNTKQAKINQELDILSANELKREEYLYWVQDKSRYDEYRSGEDEQHIE